MHKLEYVLVALSKIEQTVEPAEDDDEEFEVVEPEGDEGEVELEIIIPKGDDEEESKNPSIQQLNLF
jgi:hypothetical protein